MSVVLRFGFKIISKNRLTNQFPGKLSGKKISVKCCTVSRGKQARKWIRIQKYSSQERSQNIVKSPLGEVTVPEILFHEIIFQDWSVIENKVAVVCGMTKRRYKFKEVRKKSETLAAALQKKYKLEKGDVIAIVLPNCPEYPIIVLAASQIGVIPTTINPLYTAWPLMSDSNMSVALTQQWFVYDRGLSPADELETKKQALLCGQHAAVENVSNVTIFVDEIQTQLEDSQSKLIITSSYAFEKCVEVVNAVKKSVSIIVLKIFENDIVPDGATNLLELFNASDFGPLNPVKIELDDIAIMPYSSGTTGSPKGVQLTHRNIVSNLTQISHPETNVMKPTTMFHQDKIMGVLPMFHIYGMMIGAFYSLKEGCQVITLPKFDPVKFVKNIFRNRVGILYVVPPILELLIHNRVKKFHLKSIEYLINAASPLPTKNALALLEKAPHIKIAQGYGMTETSPVLSHTSVLRMQKLTSIGIPIASTRFKVADLETGNALGKGERGELCVFGPQVMKSYLNRPEENKNVFDSEGYMKTGDIVYYDDDGDFFVVERLKDLIKVKGFQVAPTEVEEVLRSHPHIEDAVVIGVPNADFGEVPKAFVILKKDFTLTEDDVKDFIKKKLSSYKQLRGGVVFVTDFPRNNIGKVLRKELKNL